MRLSPLLCVVTCAVALAAGCAQYAPPKVDEKTGTYSALASVAPGDATPEQHVKMAEEALGDYYDIGHLPDDRFVVTDTLLDQLRQSAIPFAQIEKERAITTSASLRGEIYARDVCAPHRQ